MTVDWSVEILSSTDSTQDYVKALAEQGADEGTFVQALEQAAGRGRHGREWVSLRGNFYASFLLKPNTIICEYPRAALVVGVALADAISLFCDKDPMLKWPNDILIEGKKCAGILLEVVEDAIVVGLGVNIKSAPEGAFSLGAGIDLEVFRAAFLRIFSGYYAQWLGGDFDTIRAAWLGRCHIVGTEVSVKHAERLIEGRFEGLDLSGNMMIKSRAGEMQVIHSGDVHFGWDEKGD